MNETIVRLGPDQRISAVISMPEKAMGGVGIILLNAGTIHRIGPGRLYVKMARALAEQGIAALRLDLSGLGESAPAHSGATHPAQAQMDLQAAITYMQEKAGAKKVYLCGICSGADLAFSFAQEHDGISGVILLDPYAYKSKAGYRRYLMRRALEIERWPGYLHRVLSRSGRKTGAMEAAFQSAAQEIRPIPPCDEFGQGVQSLLGRGVKVHIFYTRAVQYHLSAPGDFFETFKKFDFRDRLDIEIEPRFDHTFMTLEAQKTVTQKLLQWLDKV